MTGQEAAGGGMSSPGFLGELLGQGLLLVVKREHALQQLLPASHSSAGSCSAPGFPASPPACPGGKSLEKATHRHETTSL